ncbi:MAG: DUF4097 family beta strand repeat-containing protein [Steroidobacteraceae bacterium]
MRTMLRAVTALALLTACLPATAATATLTRAWQFKPDAAAGLEVRNLIGGIRIERGTEAGFHITATATIDMKSQDEADALAHAIDFRTRDVGAGSRFDVAFPKQQFPKIYYPKGPDGWWSVMYVEHLGERIRLTGDRDEAPQVRVDLVIRAPAGARLKVNNVFGEEVAEGYSGDLSLDGGSSPLRSSGGEGRLELDSGSGDVTVTGHKGRVSADTGSGSVTITDCSCEIDADTGSGDVEVCGGSGVLRADTGSGRVKVENFSGAIAADTGSGAVHAQGVSNVTELDVDTGSGSVSVDGDLSALKRLRLDTGSGSVRLQSASAPSMEIVIDTGSGQVDVNAPGATVRESDHGTWTVKLLDGSGSGVIDTGSGGVDIVVAAD